MRKAKPTKTTNRLHFEDLDPKRFEDFCHSLLFPIRTWQSMHHIGRSGDDGGQDKDYSMDPVGPYIIATIDRTFGI
jgi:hypothetical protein